jgi:hypothetical protein
MMRSRVGSDKARNDFKVEDMMFIVFQRFGVPPLGGIACGHESQQNRPALRDETPNRASTFSQKAFDALQISYIILS